MTCYTGMLGTTSCSVPRANAAVEDTSEPWVKPAVPVLPMMPMTAAHS